jgi:hypothetical protein
MNALRFRFNKTKRRQKNIKKRHELMHVIYDKSKHCGTY